MSLLFFNGFGLIDSLGFGLSCCFKIFSPHADVAKTFLLFGIFNYGFIAIPVALAFPKEIVVHIIFLICVGLQSSLVYFYSDKLRLGLLNPLL